jgi:hypothetical protein
MLRFIGATLAGLIFCAIGPIFIPVALYVLSLLYMIRQGHTLAVAQQEIGQLVRYSVFHLDGIWAWLVILGLCAIASLAAGVAAARIARDYAYVAAIVIIFVCTVTLAYIGRGAPDPIFLWLFILGGAVCVFAGCFLGRWSSWPEASRPVPSKPPADRQDRPQIEPRLRA